MELQIAVVDDLQADRERLEKDVRIWATRQKVQISQLKTYARGEDILQEFQQGMFNLVFMDIVMDELNGIETAKKLREADTDLLIVFQTTSREYAFDAFPVHPFDYIIKPYDVEKLGQVLREVVRVLNAGNTTITVRTQQGSLEVPLQKICAALSHGHSVDIYLTDKTVLQSRMAFREIEKQLLAHAQFLTCNRGVLINMDHVDSMRGGTARMKNGDQYALRVRSQREIVTKFSQYMISRMRTHMGG